jgi:hypothetical protein
MAPSYNVLSVSVIPARPECVTRCIARAHGALLRLLLQERAMPAILRLLL